MVDFVNEYRNHLVSVVVELRCVACFFLFLVSFEPKALGFPSKRPTQISTSDGMTSGNQGEFGVATREN